MSEGSNNTAHPLKWITTSDLLMIVLICVTASTGYMSYKAQKESVELQRSIYQPRFVPSDVQQPTSIEEKTLARVAISNVGYSPGAYTIKIKSDTFTFDSEKYGSGRELKIRYMLRHDKNDDHEFYVIPPSGIKSLLSRPTNKNFLTTMDLGMV